MDIGDIGRKTATLRSSSN